MGHSRTRALSQSSTNVLSVRMTYNRQPLRNDTPQTTLLLFSGAQAAIVVYDITSPDTFKRAQAWVKELRQQANSNIVIALAGNKADLAQQRTVDNEVDQISTKLDQTKS